MKVDGKKTDMKITGSKQIGKTSEVNLSLKDIDAAFPVIGSKNPEVQISRIKELISLLPMVIPPKISGVHK